MKPIAFLLLLPVALMLGRNAGAKSERRPAPSKGAPMDRATTALSTGDPKVMRKVAKELRAEGRGDMADGLERVAGMIENVKSQPAPVWPTTADPVLGILTMDEQTPADAKISAWMLNDPSGPPLTDADINPVRRRRLTPRERWLLGPYFPVVSDLNAELVFEQPPGLNLDETVKAITFASPAETTVYFPSGARSMLSRYWISVLGHELVHGAQQRIGAQPWEAAEAQLRWGYELSPLEVQARGFQRFFYADLTARAHAYDPTIGTY